MAKVAKKSKRIPAPPPAPAGDADSTSMPARICDHIAEKGIYAIVLWVPLVFCSEVFWPFDIPSVALLRALTIVVLSAYLTKVIVSRQWPVIAPPAFVTWSVLAFLLVFVISTALSISSHISIFGAGGKDLGLISLLNILVLFFLVMNVLSRSEQLMRCLKLFLISSSVVALMGFFEYYHEIDESHMNLILVLVFVGALASLGWLVRRRLAGAGFSVYAGCSFGALLLIAIILLSDVAFETRLLYERIEGAQAFRITTDPHSGFVVFGDMMGGRVASTFGNPDFLFSFLALPLPLAYMYLLQGRWLYLIPFSLLLWCLALNIPTAELGDYRVVFVGLLAVSLVPVVAMRIPRRYRVHAAALLLAIVAGVVSANVYDVRGKVDSFVDRHIGGGEADRGDLIRIAWNTVGDHPVLGSGPNTFRDTFLQYKTVAYAQEKPDRTEEKVHNSFIEAVSTMGWLGLLSYTAMIFALLGCLGRWLFRNRRSRRFLVISMLMLAGVLYVGQSLLVFHTTVPFAFFWVVMAVGIGLTREKEPREVALPLGRTRLASVGLLVLILGAAVFGVYQSMRPVLASHYYLKAQSLHEAAGPSNPLPPDTLDYYEKAVHWNGAELKYINDYAVALLDAAERTGDFEMVERGCVKAEELADRLVCKEPEQAIWYHSRARFRYNCSKYFEYVGRSDVLDAVAEDLHRAVELYPTGHISLDFLARVETERGDYAAAVDADLRGIEIKSTGLVQLARIGTNYVRLGDEYLRQGASDLADVQYTNALPHLERVFKGYAGLDFEEMDAQDRQKAQELLEQASIVIEELVEMIPGNADAHYLLGFASELKGNLDRARGEYLVAVELDPHHEEALDALERLTE